MEFDKNIGRYVGKLNYLMYRELNQVLEEQKANITAEQFRLLTHLWHEDGKSQQELSLLAGRDGGSITRMIDILERKEIVIRKPVESDRRINMVYLTKAGKKLKQKASKSADLVLNKTMKDFSDSERQALESLLYKAIENLKIK